MRRQGTLRFCLATPPQTGAVGVFHLFGSEPEIAANIEPRLRPAQNNPMKKHELRLAKLLAPDGGIVDEVLAAKPRDGMRIIMCHGGRRIMDKVAECLGAFGAARIGDSDEAFAFAGLGEPTADALAFRALAKVHTDDQAAAVLEELSRGRRENRRPVFPEEWFRVRSAVLAGPPNAGKSSLMNRLAGFDRAFVHEEAGATRDVVEELATLAGRPVLLRDLPGFSGVDEAPGNEVLAKAAAKAEKRIGEADLVFFVADASIEWNREHGLAAAAVADAASESAPVIVLLNKSDLPRRLEGTPWRAHFRESGAAATSALADGDARRVVDACVEGIWGRIR